MPACRGKIRKRLGKPIQIPSIQIDNHTTIESGERAAVEVCYNSTNNHELNAVLR